MIAINLILSFLGNRWTPLAWVLTACAVVYGNFLGVLTMIRELIAQVDGLVRPSIESSPLSVEPFAFMNALMPLDLCIAYVQLYIPFFLACATIRFVKGFVPSVAS